MEKGPVLESMTVLRGTARNKGKAGPLGRKFVVSVACEMPESTRSRNFEFIVVGCPAPWRLRGLGLVPCRPAGGVRFLTVLRCLCFKALLFFFWAAFKGHNSL